MALIRLVIDYGVRGKSKPCVTITRIGEIHSSRKHMVNENGHLLAIGPVLFEIDISSCRRDAAT